MVVGDVVFGGYVVALVVGEIVVVVVVVVVGGVVVGGVSTKSLGLLSGYRRHCDTLVIVVFFKYLSILYCYCL